MDNRQYLSILTVPSSAGNLGFTLTTIGASADLTITASVTGITTSHTESDVAKLFYDQVKIIIAQYGANYSPPASAIPNVPLAKFQITRTDHCVCLWSQAVFNLKITSNTTGAITSIRSNPTLITVTDALLYGAVMNQTFTGLTNAQIALLMELISDEVISVTRNKIVASTYLLDTWVNILDGYRLPAYPVITTDDPFVADPWQIFSISEYSTLDESDRYLIQRDGWIMYRNSQYLVFDDSDPFALGNEFRITWIAGYDHIPNTVKMALVKVSPYYTTSGALLYEELKGGTSSVKYRDTKTEKNLIFSTLSELFL